MLHFYEFKKTISILLFFFCLINQTSAQTIRYQQSVRGGFTCAMNSLRGKTSAPLYVNTDGGVNTSSYSDLILPAGSTVVKAILYMEEYLSTPANRVTSVKFKVPGGAYQTLTTSSPGFIGNPIASSYCQFIVDVTNLIPANGYISTLTAGGNASTAGRYSVADPFPFDNSTSNYGSGWALYVVYTNPSSAFRNITIADRCGDLSPLFSVTMNIPNISVPSCGTVNAVVAVTGSWGDDGATFLDDVKFGKTGSSLTALADPTTGQTNNALNSTIGICSQNNVSTDGGPAMSGNYTGRNPYNTFVGSGHPGSLYYDCDIFNANGILPPSPTPISVTFQQNSYGSDALGTGAYGISIDIASATMSLAASTASIYPGCTATYSYVISNTTPCSINLTGISFTNTLPSGIIVANPNGTSITGGSGGTVTAASGSNSVSLSGLNLGIGQSATVTVNVTNVPGQTNPNCSTNPSGFTNTYSNITGNSYNLVYTGDSVCLVVLPPPTAINGSSCGTGTVGLSISGCAGTVNWYTASSGGSSISTANTYTTPVISSTTTYYASCTINGCESARVPVVATINPPPAVTTSITNSLTCTTLTTQIIATTTASPVSYNWSGIGIVVGAITATATINSPGIYTVVVTNTTTTCATTVTMSVTQNTLSPSVTTNTSGVLNCTNTAVNINATTTTTPVSYAWSGAGITAGSGTGTITVNQPGTFNYTVTNTSNGCFVTGIQTVSQNSLTPTVTGTSSGTLNCTTQTVNVSATTTTTTTPVSYNWSGTGIMAGSGTGTITVNQPGTFNYTVTNTSNGCFVTGTQAVSQNTSTPSTIASTTGSLTCMSSSVTLNSTLTGMNYTWSAPAGGSVSSSNAQSTSASGVQGTYSLTIVNPANGCSFTTTTSVAQNTIAPTGVSAGSNQTLTCSSGSVTLNGSVTTPTNATFLWTGASVCGSTTSSITSACGAGVYTLTATNPINGCSATSTVQVSPSAGAPSVTLNPVTNSITCTNTLVMVSISSTVSPVTYTWSGTGIVSGNGTGTITVNQGGTFNFTLTNTSNGCTTSNNQIVTQNTSIPNTTASTSGTLTCSTTTVALTSTLAGVNYTWTAPSGGSISSANTQSTTSSGAAGIYTLTVNDPANGCTFTTTTSVTQNTTAISTAASTTGTLTCSITTVSLNSTTAGMNYTWTAPAGGSVASANTQSTTASGAAGTYSLLIKDPSTGCTYSTTTSVSQNNTTPSTTASTSGSLTCSSSSVTLNSTTAGMNYTWTAPAGGSVGSANTQSTFASGTPGTYSLTIVNPANGCSFTTTTSITQNTTTPITSASTTGSLTCATTTIALNSTLSGMNYTWTAPSGGSIASANTQSTSASGTSGVYSLTVVNPVNGCAYTTTTSVTQNTTTPVTSASTTGTLTCSTTTVALTSTLAGVNYTWTSPSGGTVSSANTQSTTASGAAGIYTLTVNDPANGCTFTTTTSVTQNTTAISTVASTTGTLSCSTTTVSLNSTTAGMNYTWTAPAGGSVASANTQSTTASGAAGTYSLLIKDPSTGCTYSTTTSVSQNTTIPSTTASTTGSLTCNSSSVILNSTTAGMNYTWTAPSGGNVSSANTQSTAASGTPGTYSLTIINPANGCIFTTTTSVTQNTIVPTGVSAGNGGTLTCAVGSSVNLNGSVTTPTNATASWTGSNFCGNPTNVFVTAACGAGVYTLTATNPSNGCTATSTVEVFPSIGSPSVTNTPITNTLTCSNTSFTISVTTTVSPVSYAWNGPGIVGSATGSVITVNSGGTYNYTVTSTANGCTTSGNQTVSQNTTTPVTTASATGSLNCLPASTVALNSTLTGMNYTWTAPSGGTVSSANTQSTSASGSIGTYSLTLVDPSNGCVYATTTSVTQNTVAPTLTLSPMAFTTTCSSPTVQLTASTTDTDVSYQWTTSGGSLNNSTIANPIASGSGTYTVVITNTLTGCSASKTATITPDASVPSATISSSTATITCSNSTPGATVTASPSSNLTYSWNPNPASGVTSSNATFSSSGTYTCVVTNTVNGCNTSVQIAVSTNSAVPVINITNSQTVTCTNPSVTISTTVTPSATYNYTWTGSPASGQGTGAIQANTAGNYSVIVVNPANSCSATASSNVSLNTNPPAVTATNSSTLTCTNPSTVLTATGGGTYQWVGSGIVSGGTSANPTVNSPGTYSVTVTAANGCTSTATSSVSQDNVLPSVTVSNTQTITCSVTSVNLNATGGGNYSWSGPGIVSGVTSSGAVVNAPGAYSVTVTSSNGCSTTSVTNVVQNTPTPTITITSITPSLTCLLTSVTINASGGGTYAWSGPGIVSGGNSATPTVNMPGNYSLTVTDANGCVSTTVTSVAQNTVLPALVTSPDIIITPGSTTTLSATGGNSTYTWSPSNSLSCATCANPEAAPEETTEYCVTSTEGICTSRSCVTVKVEINCETTSDYTTPNAFSPNGDGINDEFCLEGWKGCLTGFNIVIYNRWGNQVFESTQENFCWDGIYMGKLLDPAVFVFYIKAEKINGGKIERKGNITLIK